jgi:hypothetical protein
MTFNVWDFLLIAFLVASLTAMVVLRRAALKGGPNDR